MSRAAELSKLYPDRKATSEAWAEHIQRGNTVIAELPREIDTLEEQRLMHADDFAEFSRAGKRIAALQSDLDDVRVAVQAARNAHTAALKREADEREAERLKNLSSCMQAREGKLLRADSIIAQLVECIGEVEHCEAQALSLTTPADMARLRDKFNRGHADLVPVLLTLLQGHTCSANLDGYALPWPVTAKNARWSERCGIRPPEPRPAPPNDTAEEIAAESESA